MVRRIVGPPLGAALRLAGRAYVPGGELGDALVVTRRAAAAQMACTLGYFHSAGDSPTVVAEACRATVDAVADLAPKGYLSLKAPAFGYDFPMMAPVLASARDRGILVHFDSHEHSTAEPTLACVLQAVGLGGAIGLTVPGRWRRSPDDAVRLAGLGLRLRVVKGEWADPGAPDRDARQGFLEVVEALAGQGGEVAVASHDAGLVRECLSRLRRAGTTCEVELLHGLPRRQVLAVAREFAVPVRLYVPFGIAWRPYALGKVAENPRMLAWFARDLLTGLAGRWGQAAGRARIER